MCPAQLGASRWLKLDFPLLYLRTWSVTLVLFVYREVHLNAVTVTEKKLLLISSHMHTHTHTLTGVSLSDPFTNIEAQTGSIFNVTLYNNLMMCFISQLQENTDTRTHPLQLLPSCQTCLLASRCQPCSDDDGIIGTLYLGTASCWLHWCQSQTLTIKKQNPHLLCAAITSRNWAIKTSPSSLVSFVFPTSVLIS